MINGKTIAAICAAALLASPALGQAPAAPTSPPAITQEALDAVAAISRGQAMTANAAKRLCELGQRDYCQEPAQANAPTSPPAISQEALDAARALSAYQRGQAMTTRSSCSGCATWGSGTTARRLPRQMCLERQRIQGDRQRKTPGLAVSRGSVSRGSWR